MEDLKLTIDLLPKGAWGNNLSSILPQKDWDTLRKACYKRAKHCCSICGKGDTELDAHEVWDFDTESRVQTLMDIVALCSACHGVKHMRNSERMGHGENAKNHFLKINKCNPLTLAQHYTQALLLFEERNEVLRWKIKSDLDRFGGEGMQLKERYIPLINNPYDGIDWQTVEHVKMKDTNSLPKSELGEEYIAVILTDGSNDGTSASTPMYLSSPSMGFFGPPKIRSIEVDNYQGTITVVGDDVNRIEWIMDGEIVKTKYNTVGEFTVIFSVEDLEGSHVVSRLIGDGGQTCSQAFRLAKAK